MSHAPPSPLNIGLDGLSFSTAAVLQHLKACPTHPSLGLPILDPISFLKHCDEQGIPSGVMCGKQCGSCTDWSELMSGGMFDEQGPFQGGLVMSYSKPFLDAMEVQAEPTPAARIRMWRNNTAIANQREGVVKTCRRFTWTPTAFQNIMYHTVTNNGKSTFSRVHDFIVILQAAAWPSSGFTSHGRSQMQHLLSDGQPRLGNVTKFEVGLSVSDTRVRAAAVREHDALECAPAIVMTCSTEGHVITQNAASRAMLGILAADHRLAGLPDAIQACLPPVYQAGSSMNYLLELFGSQEALDAAMKKVQDRGQYRKRLQIRSPVLLRLMQLPVGSSRHHEVIVTKLRDGVTSQHVYLVVQMDMTERAQAEQHFTDIKQQQRDLLKDILPAQVLSVMLDRKHKTASLATSQSRTASTLFRALSERLKDSLACEIRGPISRPGSIIQPLSRQPSGPSGLRPAADSFTASEAASLNGAVNRSDGSVLKTELQDLSSGDVQQLSTYHSCVSILFAHIEGFTDIVQKLHPGEVMVFLNDLFNEFDLLVEEHDVYKVETIGDTYMVCSGLFDRSSQQQPSQAPSSTAASADVTQAGQERTSTASSDNTNQNVLGGHDPQHASKMVAFAKALLLVSSSVVSPLGEAVKLHVGVHSGPIMTGVVGRKMPRFCCFGDTVNTASRMMTTSGPDIIHASASFRDLTPDQPWQPTGGIEVKGKGHMDTYVLASTDRTSASGTADDCC